MQQVAEREQKGGDLLKKKLERTDLLILLYSFTIPAFIMLVCFALKGIAPLGERSLISMDGFSQYYPMLMNMGESIKDGELFYSFSGALGFNLWAQNAYYTNSPLWLILYLLPHSAQVVAIDLIIVLKVCLAGLFFAVRLLKKGRIEDYKKRFFVYTALSVCYALSAYMLAFINQLMWTDVIVLLPLTVLGIEELFENKKPALYIITLFLSVWSCFYISYMVCLFACLYFVYLAFREKHLWKDIFRKGVLFALSSLCAGGMASVVLIPTAKALSLTMASDMGFTEGIELKYKLWEFLRQFLPFQEVSLEFGAPNLYCSVFAVILLCIFFFIKKVPLRERVVSFIFVTFMCLSMSVNIGEFVWHGFHFPNQLPARQSFLLIFLILALGAKSAENLTLKKPGRLNAACVVAIVGVSLSFFTMFMAHTWTSRTESLQRYESSFEKLQENLDDDSFYRVEWTGEKKNNLPQQCTYNGICYYSSTMSADAYNFFQNLGMERYAARVSTHYTGTQMTDDLFSVRYVLREKAVFENENQRFDITVNEDALPLGYLSDKAVVTLDLSAYEPGKESQKALFNSIVPNGDDNYDEAIAYLNKNGFIISEFDTDYIKGSAKAEKDGVFLFSIPYDEGWTVKIDGEKAETKKAAGYLLCCDITEGNHEITLKYTVPGIKLGAVLSLIALAGAAAIIAVTKRKHTV